MKHSYKDRENLTDVIGKILKRKLLRILSTLRRLRKEESVITKNAKKDMS